MTTTIWWRMIVVRWYATLTLFFKHILSVPSSMMASACSSSAYIYAQSLIFHHSPQLFDCLIFSNFFFFLYYHFLLIFRISCAYAQRFAFRSWFICVCVSCRSIYVDLGEWARWYVLYGTRVVETVFPKAHQVDILRQTI